MKPTDSVDTPFSPADHARVWALLPWLVNGSADDSQRADAQAHLAHCADCRAELQWQTELHAGFQHASVPLPDAEAGLQRLLGRLDSEALPDQPAAGFAPPTSATAMTASATTGTTSGTAANSGRLTRWLAAAVVVQAIALGTLGTLGLVGTGQGPVGASPRLASTGAGRTADAGYRALSDSDAPASQARWRVVPDAQLPLGQWQLLLLQQGLQVVEGPNTAGAYGLAPAAAAAATDAADTLARLRAHPGIRMAEPVAR